MIKSDNDIVNNLFPSLPRLFQGDQICRHDNKIGIYILNYEQLPNASIYIKLLPASIEKRHFKQIADCISE